MGHPGAPFRPDTILSYGFWQTHFHGDRKILGHAITLNKTSFTIVGLLPKSFAEINAEEHIDALLGVLAIAFVIPAARAASVDPAEAVREE